MGSQKWLAWFKELGEKSHIKYPPLERTGKVVRRKQKSADLTHICGANVCRNAKS